MSELAKIMGNVGRAFMSNLPTEATIEDVRKGYAEVKEELREIIGDMSLLGSDDLIAIGFIYWDNVSHLHLIPVWAFDFVKDGTELTNTIGVKKTKGIDDIYMDQRLGFTNWGFIVPPIDKEVKE